jgi:hypothetical protein
MRKRGDIFVKEKRDSETANALKIQDTRQLGVSFTRNKESKSTSG